MAKEFIPKDAEFIDAEILPKTTLELRWVAPSERRTNWLIILYLQNGKRYRTKISIA